MFGCFVFAKLGCFVKQSKKYFYFLFLYYSKFRCSGSWLTLKSVPELCLIISRAARYLPKQALNNIPSLCVYYDLYVTEIVNILRIWEKCIIPRSPFLYFGLFLLNSDFSYNRWWGIYGRSIGFFHYENPLRTFWPLCTLGLDEKTRLEVMRLAGPLFFTFEHLSFWSNVVWKINSVREIVSYFLLTWRWWHSNFNLWPKVTFNLKNILFEEMSHLSLVNFYLIF